jgi:diguanylate cyclase (GGDEF)-like protein
VSTGGAKSLQVLVVEDSDEDSRLIKRNLEEAGYRVHLERVDTRVALLDALRRKHWDIVFSDFSMPAFDGMEALKVVRKHDRDLPFIVVSGTIGEERAVQLMKLGAQDYLIKDNIRRLIPAVERELKEMRLRREHRLAQEHIQRLAYYDSLTQLPNRHRLLEDLQQRLDQAGPAILMVVNLSNFREVNGALGYGRGDELIREAAGRMQELHLEDTDLYHLYGNEFALLVSNDNRAYAESVAQTILKALASHYLTAGYRIHIGARIGIVASPVKEASTLLQRADLAATLAKHESKGYVWYAPERDPTSPRRLALLADLHDAIGTDQLFLVFQPKVQSGTGAITGCEALLRWQHPEQGLIMPEVFIEMAEQSGVIDEIARHVLLRVVDQLGHWQERGLILPISINLSVKNLLNPQLMAEILHAAMLKAGNGGIEIEITETALMRDPDRAMAALHRFYDAGIRISVDDFGIGFSSLSYLKRLPIHAIKIDKSFVVDLVRNPDSDAIVRSTIGLAHNLALKVVAEGVEDRAIWHRLTNYHCDEGQGNYFGTPLRATELEMNLGAWLPRAYAHQ